MSSAGIISINVSSPYPVWCEIYIDEERVGRIHHRSLADLLHATKQAMKEARLVLGNDTDEV